MQTHCHYSTHSKSTRYFLLRPFCLPQDIVEFSTPDNCPIGIGIIILTSDYSLTHDLAHLSYTLSHASFSKSHCREAAPVNPLSL